MNGDSKSFPHFLSLVEPLFTKSTVMQVDDSKKLLNEFLVFSINISLGAMGRFTILGLWFSSG